MTFELISYVLVGLLLSQQLLWMLFTHRLINKVMSRDFHDYQRSVKPASTFHVEQRVSEEPAEDLRTLQEFVG